MAKVVINGVQHQANEVIIEKGSITLDGKLLPNLNLGQSTLKQAVVCLVIKEIEGEDCILLLKRKDHPQYGVQWCLPGGKVDYHHITVGEEKILVKEESVIAAIRELREETGIKATSIYAAKHNRVWADDNYVVECFLVDEYKEDDNFKFPTREHTEMKWTSVDELNDLEDFSDFTKSIIKELINV